MLCEGGGPIIFAKAPASPGARHKTTRDADAKEAKATYGGGTIITGICTGALTDKEFILDKKHDKPEDLCAQLELVKNGTRSFGGLSPARRK